MSTEITEIDDQIGLAHLSATIATELAAGLTEPASVPTKFNMTEEQWARLKKSKFFHSMMREAAQKFTGDLGAQERITLKAQILLEDMLPVLHEIGHNEEGSTQSKIDVVKELKTLAGVTKNDKGGPAGGGFNVQIHINTGEDNPTPVIDIEPTSNLPSEEAA